jgi:hypothetical protein
VHYAGIFSFMVLGLSPVALSLWWAIVWFAGIAPMAALNRSSLLTVAIVPAFTALMRPTFKYYIVVCLIGGGLGLLYLSGADVSVPREGKGIRSMSAEQLVEDVQSILGDTSSGSGSDLYGTMRWRMLWWNKIVDDTVFGDNFWTGRGFGINLADEDGFQTEHDHSLRDPHNIHMTVLARMGVPGLIIWLSLLASFAVKLFGAVLRDLRNGRGWLARVEIWVLAYWLAFIVNGSFDVFLEGPQAGIWFWSIFGFGLALIVMPKHMRMALSQANTPARQVLTTA